MVITTIAIATPWVMPTISIAIDVATADAAIFTTLFRMRTDVGTYSRS